MDDVGVIILAAQQDLDRQLLGCLARSLAHAKRLLHSAGAADGGVLADEACVSTTGR